MRQTTGEETKTEEGNSVGNELSTSPDSSETDEQLVAKFADINISKCTMIPIDLSSSVQESESEEDEDEVDGETIKRGPTNGVPVSCMRNQEFYFDISQDQFNGNTSKRIYDHSEDPYCKYRRPVPANELTEIWLNKNMLMNGGTVESYESENSQNASCSLSDDSRSSLDLSDNVSIITENNDAASSNHDLDDLMVILAEDSISLKRNLKYSSKDSHIRNIKETLKNGFDVISSDNISENTSFEYPDINYSKASPPPQCVPQLTDPHFSNFEITEYPNINNIKSENNSQMPFRYGHGHISMNRNTQEQVLLNSAKQTAIADRCSINNAPQFMRQHYINDDNHNFINLCNQGQIPMNKSTQSRPIMNACSKRQTVMNIGIDKHTTMSSSTQIQRLQNYGDQGQILMNGGLSQQQSLNTSSQGLNMVSAVCQGQTEMNTHNNIARNIAQAVINAGNQGHMMNPSNPNQAIINAGSPNQTILNAGSPNQTILNAGSPNQTILNAGSPTQTIVNAGSPSQTIVNAGSPSQTILNAGSPSQTIVNAGSPTQTILNAGSPAQTILNAGSPTQTIVNAGSPSQTIVNAGSPSQTIVNAGSPNQTIVNTGSPAQTIVNTGSPAQTILNAGSPSQTILNAGSPNQTISNAGSPNQTIPYVDSSNQTIVDADSPSHTILNDDEQEQIIMNATSKAQSINNGRRNWMDSIDGVPNLPPNKAPLIYSPVTEHGQRGQVYPSQSQHVIINRPTSNLQNPTVPNQTTTPVTLTSPTISSTPLILIKTPPLYIMSPTSNTIFLVQKPQPSKSTLKPILPKPPASEAKPPALDEHIFPKHFNTAKKGKAIYNNDANALKPGTSHQLIARRCVASRTDDELLAVDSEGNNYLHAAVCVTDVNMVKALLERIKRINKLTIINDCNLINQTPLYLAVSNNKPAVVCELVRNGANPNIIAEVKINETEKKRRSALHCAATQGKDFNLTLKQLFESKKIDPNIKNCDGLTPLLCAIMDHGKIVSKNNRSIMIDNAVNVSLLLKNGADPEIYDGRNGMSPLMYAIESKDIILVEAIVKYVDAGKFQKMLLAKTFVGRTCSMIAEELQNKYELGVYRKLTSILSLNK